jgi:hypothetical protein
MKLQEKLWLEVCSIDYLKLSYTIVSFYKKVFNTEPDFTREGGSIPVTLTFQDLTGKNVLLLPIGSSDDGAHSQNEKLNISNYIQGV